MKTSYYISFLLGVLLLVACGENVSPEEKERRSMETRISQLEKFIDADAEMVHRDSAQSLLIAYQDYYNKFRNDTLAPGYLLRAARIAEGTARYSKAIELLINYHDGYRTAADRDFVLYRVGFINDEHLGNKDAAEYYYNKVIELYPDSKWADEAKNALVILRLTPEELIRFLEQKNQSLPV